MYENGCRCVKWLQQCCGVVALPSLSLQKTKLEVVLEH